MPPVAAVCRTPTQPYGGMPMPPMGYPYGAPPSPRGAGQQPPPSPMRDGGGSGANNMMKWFGAAPLPNGTAPIGADARLTAVLVIMS